MNTKEQIEFAKDILKKEAPNKYQDIFIAKPTDGFFRRAYLSVRRLALYDLGRLFK